MVSHSGLCRVLYRSLDQILPSSWDDCKEAGYVIQGAIASWQLRFSNYIPMSHLCPLRQPDSPPAIITPESETCVYLTVVR